MDCGTIEDEGIKVDNLDDDDNACCWEPTTGMCFSCLEEVKSFYEEYALRKGFGWKIRSSRKGQDGELCYLILSCSRKGSKVSKISCTLKILPTKVNNCPAKIVIKLNKDGLWYITKFEPDHTHETSPTKARLFKANKKMNLHVKRTIQINDDAGVRINKTFQSLVKDAGGHENVPFVKEMEQNSDFFYDIDFDDDFHVRNVFWANARSRAAYEYFGDVVTFDTTYLTNKYDMPFVAFVGVNHHGKAPLGIVTDQCKAMKNAIEFKFALKEAVYDTVTKEAFEEKWRSFIEKFELQQNDWLNGLYNEHHRWAPTLQMKYFWAGMSTTQRSESIHSFFDGYINSPTSLNQFVKQYDNALKSRVEKEFEADFNSIGTTISCGSNSSIEKQFQGEYTHAKFKEVQT
ncbi:protein FAR1-RELATED SEQUENCE 5-like [Cicer arietinum]|uniref:Protein FAR1-RELATED SEQUENCE n=1 Tax=Cicer arietinum TaxID=3827 RepID=A0A1S3EJI5_CICAR|nr:protein FAR1-RELATED SEQUENCE 5-like [Cicer arietinum]